MRPSSASFLDSVGRSRLRSFLASSSPLILLFLILRHPSYSFLEWRRRGATGRLGRRLGSRGAATTPGPRWVPEAATPEAGPGSSARRLPPITTSTAQAVFTIWMLPALNHTELHVDLAAQAVFTIWMLPALNHTKLPSRSRCARGLICPRHHRKIVSGVFFHCYRYARQD